MSTRPDPDHVIESWLGDEARDGASDRLLTATRRQLESTIQRRAWWPVRRFGEMNTYAKVLIAAAAVAVLAVVGLNALPKRSGVGAPGPSASPASLPSTVPPSAIASPSPSDVPAAFPDSPLPAGTYTIAPFTAAGEGMCHAPPQSGCTETTADDTIRVTATVPDGWSGFGSGIWLTGPGNGPPDGAGLLFLRGAWLLSDPCKYIATDIPVGPTVADFVDAVATHPILDTTTPVDVTLAGYAGKYFDLQVPADISMCEAEPNNPSSGPIYRPWEPGIYAQGPGHRWHLWVVDVDGVRVVVQSMDYAGTSEERRTELAAIVDSIQIEP
jgi:hypothetical protein